MTVRLLTYTIAAVVGAVGVVFAIASLALGESPWWETWGLNIAVTFIGTAVTVALINGMLECAPKTKRGGGKRSIVGDSRSERRSETGRSFGPLWSRLSKIWDK